MNRPDVLSWARGVVRRARVVVLALGLTLLLGSGASAQQTQTVVPPGAPGLPPPGGDPEEDMLSRILSETRQTEAARKDRLRPPFELLRSQVLPNDILPYIKANHWTMIGLEMRANHFDYEGLIQSLPVGLLDQPNEVVYRRDARLIKGQTARLTLPVLLPTIPKEIGFQLTRPEAIRPDDDMTARLDVLEPHQQLVVILSKEANDAYSRWNTLRTMIPAELRKDDPTLLNKHRYYRMVLPLDPEKPLLPAHPLTWSTISHVVWDGLPPERIGVAQQQALVDWLHWGGQLVISGGPGPAFAPLRESFLAPYLPAEPSGTNASRTGAELAALSRAYPPTFTPIDEDEAAVTPSNLAPAELQQRFGRRYRDPVAITTDDRRPIQFTGLTPNPGASVIPLGGPDDPPLAVEWRVGRGRVTMLAASLTDPDLARWAGYDSLVRRVVLRRPEEQVAQPTQPNNVPNPPNTAAHFELLLGPELTNVRYFSRDLGAPGRVAPNTDGPSYTVNGFQIASSAVAPVGEWLDSATLPTMSREVLERASGIEIPNPNFVLKVILAYLIALVPLNWLVCRYVLGRREWAWVVVPVLALGFAYGVERLAAFDVGFDSSADEIDVIETHGDYPRAHVSRFASIYSTGRVRYSIEYPSDPTALALPLATGRSLRGEEIVQSSLRTLPNPALTDFLVQPRSLSLFRAEQMPSLNGTLSLQPPASDAAPGTLGQVVNRLGFDLADAWVVEVGRRPQSETNPAQLQGVHVGAIANGATIALPPLEALALPPEPGKVEVLDPRPFERLLLDRANAERPGEAGEIRLIGRIDRAMPGQAIEPPPDRQRGFTLVVAHLRPGPLADSARAPFFSTVALKPPTDPPADSPTTPAPRRGRR